MTLELWWGAELGMPDRWRWHFDYYRADDALASQQWHEYKAGIPARLVVRTKRYH